jgi:hypothetical protein
MSYDLFLIPTSASEDPEEYLERQEEVAGQLSPEAEARKRALADRLKVLSGPSLEEFAFDFAEIATHLKMSEAEARRDWRHIELNSPEGGPGIQIELQDSSASVALPYWHSGATAESTWAEVWRYLEVLQNEGGYSVFDPQLGRVLSLNSDRSVVMGKYSDGVQFTEQIVTKKSGQQKPWWKFW